jgi:hypothetical protein
MMAALQKTRVRCFILALSPLPLLLLLLPSPLCLCLLNSSRCHALLRCTAVTWCLIVFVFVEQMKQKHRQSLQPQLTPPSLGLMLMIRCCRWLRRPLRLPVPLLLPRAWPRHQHLLVRRRVARVCACVLVCVCVSVCLGACVCLCVALLERVHHHELFVILSWVCCQSRPCYLVIPCVQLCVTGVVCACVALSAVPKVNTEAILSAVRKAAKEIEKKIDAESGKPEKSVYTAEVEINDYPQQARCGAA